MNAVAAGRLFLPISVGALLSHMDLIDRARQTGAQIIVPTGALLGLDAVRAAAEGTIDWCVTLTTRKPPGPRRRALSGGERYLRRGLSEAKLVFSGSAREGRQGLSGQCQRRRRRQPGRYRAGPHPPRNLGRPGDDP